MRHRGNTMLSFGDIMSILLVCMVLVCILMSAKIAQEQFTNINLETQQKEMNQVETPGATDLFLTVTGNGAYVFEGGVVKKPRTVITHEEAVETLEEIMPSKVFLRADQKVNFGTVHRVFNAAKDLGIPVALAARLP